jgi:subtilisin family serine protease
LLDDYVVTQYEIDQRYSLQEVTRAIEQARSNFPAVQQELNWVTGPPPQPVGGNPWGPEGSPWGPEGSPWGPEGSPWGPEGSPWGPEGSPWGDGDKWTGDTVLGVGGKAFRDQWAFSSDEGVDSQAASAPTADTSGRGIGQGVLVGVFDTSPFPPPMVEATFVLTPTGQPWTLSLVHPIPGGQPADRRDRLPVPNHGLFAAGLVHAVAPQSQIELIRVLDDNGQGDLQTLNRALVEFMQRVAQADGPQAAVINLSLGLHLLPEEKLQGLPGDAQSLRTILQVATECLPIVVVAASGNDSAKSDKALVAQIPAVWGMEEDVSWRDRLIAVAASNQERRQSCFSNEGEVSAPGGDGAPGTTNRCEQKITTCAEDCPLGVLSLAISSPSGYTYWNGTSFAAPLVSGQAAVLLSNGMASGQVEPCIRSATSSGQGISVANVAKSLNECGLATGQ